LLIGILKDEIINKNDLFVDNSKNEIEKRLEKAKRDKEILQKKVTNMEKQMNNILELINELWKKVG